MADSPAASAGGNSYDFYLAFAPSDSEAAGSLYAALAEHVPGRIVPDVGSLPPALDVGTAFIGSVRSATVMVVVVTPATEAGLFARADVRLGAELAKGDPAHHKLVPLLVGVAPAAFAGLGMAEGLDAPVEAAGMADLLRVAGRLVERLAGSEPRPPRPSREDVNEMERLLVERQRHRHRETRVSGMATHLDLLGRQIAAGALVRAGDVVAGTRLVRSIATDSFSSTWYSKREGSGEPCVTKVFRGERVAEGMLLWAFRRAIRALQQLNEPAEMPRSIIKLLQVSDDTLAFSTEFVQEGTLEHVASRGWSLEQKTRIFTEVCRAVEFAHRVNVIHGDIKPGNIFLDAELNPVLSDFALSAPRVLSATPPSDATLAAPLYLAPELRDSEATERSDIYSLGRLLHYLLIERSPGPQSASEKRFDNLARFPPALVQVVRQATELDPAERQASVTEILAALAERAPDRMYSLKEVLAVEPRPPGLAPQLSAVYGRAAPAAPRAASAAPPPARAPRSSTWIAVVAALVVAAGLGVGARSLSKRRASPPTPASVIGRGGGPVAAGAPTRPYSAACTPAPVNCKKEEITDEHGIVFVRVCGGTLCMGSAADDHDARKDEQPLHPVDLPDYWIAKYEVSNADYRKHDQSRTGLDDLPATNISWTEAHAFCASMGHRLPSEAEWEYAARGSDGRKYPWGDLSPTPVQAVFGRAPGSSQFHPESVQRQQGGEGPFGTLNQAGNVQEWVEDCYQAEGYAKQVERQSMDPMAVDSPDCDRRVLRGGSYVSSAWAIRAQDRRPNIPQARLDSIGLRCVR